MIKSLTLLFIALISLLPGPVLAKTATLPDASLSAAEYKFGIRNISQYRNTVTFVIPQNARDHQKKGDAVVTSAIYSLDEKPSEPCPVVDSHDVRKDLQQYDPFSGKARIIATFDDPAVAKRAAESRCLLIRDNKG